MRIDRLVVSLVLLIAAMSLAGCGDAIDEAYDECIDHIEAGIAEAEREMGGSNAASMSALARSAGETGCRAMRDACRADPDSPMCKAALDGLRRR